MHQSRMETCSLIGQLMPVMTYVMREEDSWWTHLGNKQIPKDLGYCQDEGNAITHRRHDRTTTCMRACE